MKQGEYIRVLANFITGEIGLAEFGQLIEERLIDLRQTPEMTDEKRNLSSIQLYIHEAEEGQRSRFEVYAHVQSILDKTISIKIGSQRVVYFPIDRQLRYGPDRKKVTTHRESKPLPVAR
ncbi:MAG: hypothetical protein A2Y60_06145 [Chloroflexi bacterium RBG_13_54_9]|nr:MAG: hypothetical protein A2Y60_06145 [Chloroflexi bacterium RBG_13_54_9]